MKKSEKYFSIPENVKIIDVTNHCPEFIITKFEGEELKKQIKQTEDFIEWFYANSIFIHGFKKGL